MLNHAPLPPAARDRVRLWLTLLPAMTLPFFASLVYFVLLPGGRLAQGIYAATKAFTLLWPAAVWLVIEKRQPVMKQRPARTAALAWGAGSGLFIAAAALTAYFATPIGPFVGDHRAAIVTKVESLGRATPAAFWTFAAFLAAAHSLIEEYYWRWFVFGRLSRVLPTGWAVTAAALAFAAHHYVVLSAFFPPAGIIAFGTAVAVGGGWWCLLYRRHGTLIGCWLSHALVDAAILGIASCLLFNP